ncbi:MAG: hypothetical protein IT481_08690 [Gammaproteobacteria bacterium]|nr:hypothetical protein [Gammaproteobacteria bacterium]
MAQGRRKLCELLLEIERRIAPDLLKIDEYKDALRALSDETGEGFAEEIPGLGTVQVKAGREAEITGTSPQLVVASYLALTAAQQKRHIDAGLVEIVTNVKRAAKASVTVRL